MKIGILGTRGIPNNYGGFEQFAEFFSVFLADKGHEVYVYSSHDHKYQEKKFKNVNIVHCFDAEFKMGTAGQFVYDLNCILDARKRKFDILLQLGYTSSSIWYKLLPKKAIIISNMDGLEWKRSKYSKPVQRFLKLAEKLAANSSDFLVADSIGIQKHLKETYRKDSRYIAYGADLFEHPEENILLEYQLRAFEYNMLIARLEPENNIETILNGVHKSNETRPFLVIGKYQSKYGSYLKDKFKADERIRFLGGVYNLVHLNNLRYFSNLYFHGHSVGGTNPSLLEAMASNTLIIAHDNIFNKTILKDNAFYFKNDDDIKIILQSFDKENYLDKINNNMIEIKESFSWNKINNKYLDFFNECYSKM